MARRGLTSLADHLQEVEGRTGIAPLDHSRDLLSHPAHDLFALPVCLADVKEEIGEAEEPIEEALPLLPKGSWGLDDLG
jgi:hypothetical protein